jgi:hypothetical protein
MSIIISHFNNFLIPLLRLRSPFGVQVGPSTNGCWFVAISPEIPALWLGMFDLSIMLWHLFDFVPKNLCRLERLKWIWPSPVLLFPHVHLWCHRSNSIKLEWHLDSWQLLNWLDDLFYFLLVEFDPSLVLFFELHSLELGNCQISLLGIQMQFVHFIF